MVSGVGAAAWRRCDRLHELYEVALKVASRRKLRLFAAACCRRVEAWMPGPLAAATLDVAERYADGRASEGELGEAELTAFLGFAAERDRPAVQMEGVIPWTRQAELATRALSLLVTHGAYQALDCATHARMVPPRPQGEAWDAERREEAAQCELLREVVGPAAHRAVHFDAAWALRDDAAARRLAEAIYEDGEWGLMPILADALEEAGCGDEELLAHARCGADHVKGCWVVDLVLRRE
jgi:hypothetical protein